MAGFCLHKKGHAFQLILAVVLLEHKAGGTDKQQQGEDNMSYAIDQIRNFYKDTDISGRKFYRILALSYKILR